jgi:hypothetical protein
MRRIMAVILLVFSLQLVSYSQESLTITTYYPAPFGVYNELRSKRMAIGANYYQQSQYTSFDNNGSLAANEIGRYADLVVQRYLGVGTHQPLGELHIKERPMADGSGNANRPKIYLEDIDTIPGTSDTYKFGLTLRSPRSDGLYGLNWYFPMHSSEPSNGAFMQVEENQNVRLFGNLIVRPSAARTIPARVGIGVTAPTQLLDVNGAIKIATTTRGGAGSIRWTGSDFQGHNGTRWSNLGGGNLHIETGQVGALNIRTQAIFNHNVNVPAGYNRNNCNLFVSMRYFGWLGQNKSCGMSVNWRNSTTNVSQWNVTCKHRDGDGEPSWRDGLCNYQIICQ